MDVSTPAMPQNRLFSVLEKFQTASNKSLCGPGGFSWAVGTNDSKSARAELELQYRKGISNVESAEHAMPYDLSLKPSFSVQRMPLLVSADNSVSAKTETCLEGEAIACFVVGGEKRLCLPQILNTVLREYSLQQINPVCDELHIYCSRCNQEQLEIFKQTGVLPVTAASCGLIRNTDAERLCSALLYAPDRCIQPSDTERCSVGGLRVYHECFGECSGVMYPDRYTSPSSQCIECDDCGQMFAPQKFVSHSHRDKEHCVVHWGFDSANWRSYLLVAKHTDDENKLLDLLSSLKNRFKESNKRKKHDADGAEYGCAKRIPPGGAGRETLTTYPSSAMSEGSAYSLATSVHLKKPELPLEHCARVVVVQPLVLPPPSYLHKGPPVLADPNSVVPYSDSSRYGKHFAPNVSLAPLAHALRPSGSTNKMEPSSRCGSDSSRDQSAPAQLSTTAVSDADAQTARQREPVEAVAEQCGSTVATLTAIFGEVMRHCSLDDENKNRLLKTFEEHCMQLQVAVEEAVSGQQGCHK